MFSALINGYTLLIIVFLNYYYELIVIEQMII